METENKLTNRQSEILQLLIKNSVLSYNEISSKLEVSEMTVRRDVEELINQNYVQKNKPGLIELKSGFEIDPGFSERHNSNLAEKISIALKAVNLVEENMVIGLDASTTSLELSKLLTKFNSLNVITNSLSIPAALITKKDFNIFLSGGELRHEAYSLVGQTACENISKYNYDYTFFSVNALDPERGLTDTSEKEVNTKFEMLKNARKKVLLADHTKFNRISFCYLCDISYVDILITDSKTSEEDIEMFERNGVKVIIA